MMENDYLIYTFGRPQSVFMTKTTAWSKVFTGQTQHYFQSYSPGSTSHRRAGDHVRWGASQQL